MTRYAFLIGCEEYSNFSNIAFCEADVGLIEETLLDYCDYEYKNIKRIFQYKDCDDGPNIIYSKLQKMIDNTEKGDSILFYFAGHGVKEDEKGYLLLADSKASDLQKTALDLAKINELLRKSNIDCFMILDACHSGIFSRNAFISSVIDIVSDTGCITLASCSANEESYSYQEMQQGVFTYYLCEEIKKISFGEPIFIENLKIKVCKSVIEWGKKNSKIQNPTLNGQIVGNKALAYRNYNNYTIIENSIKGTEDLKFSEIMEILKEGKLELDNLIAPSYMDYKEDKVVINLKDDLIEKIKEQKLFWTLDLFFEYLSEQLLIGNSENVLDLLSIGSLNTNQTKCKFNNTNIKKYRRCIIDVQNEKNIDKQSEIQSIALSLMYDKIYDVFNRKFSKYKNYEMDFIHEGYFSILYMMQEISPSLKDDEIEQYVDVCINNYMQKYVDFLRKRGEL